MYKLIYKECNRIYGKLSLNNEYVKPDFKLNFIFEKKQYGKKESTIPVFFEESIYVHKYVLRGEYFDSLLSGNYEKVVEATLNVKYEDNIYLYIKYLYTNKYYSYLGNDECLEDLADFLCDDNLLEVIELMRKEEIIRWEDDRLDYENGW